MQSLIRSMSEERDKKIKVVPEGFKGIVPEGRSAVRHILADVHGVAGTLYRPTDTYEEARAIDDAYAVLEGDWGGQVYLVAPIQLVHCKEETLRRLLENLDEIAWPGQPDGQGLYYEQYHQGQVVPGGMGGGLALSDVWMHAEFVEYGLQERILNVLKGELSRLGLSPEEVKRIREIDKARQNRRLKELRSKKGRSFFRRLRKPSRSFRSRSKL